ncbi:MAG: FliM/FliN family flagellar motor C-terminal domain-containing protein [Candidatus Cybelea sp.]
MRRVRAIRFDARASLPTSAACVVANGVRETLTSLFGTPASMRICEPMIPPAHTWPAIVRNAMLYRVRGSVADAALVLRATDAIAIASTIFGESPGAVSTARELSRIERDVIDRTATAIAANFGAVCGAREGHNVERVGAIGGFVTYFELLLEEPVAASVGIALSRDPAPEPLVRLELGHLAGVGVVVFASVAIGPVEAGAIARLAPGSVLSVPRSQLSRCALTATGRPLALGHCGVRNGRFALQVDSPRDGRSAAAR